MDNLAEMEERHGALWRFDTANYTVACWAEEEDEDPADSFQFDEDIAAVREGRVDWFRAVVGVFQHDGSDPEKFYRHPELDVRDDEDFHLIAYDVLGGCAYANASDFVSGANRNGYFRDMVRQAVREAKGVVALRREGLAA